MKSMLISARPGLVAMTLAVSALLLLTAGCAPKRTGILRDYRLVKPTLSDKAVYESDEFKIAFDIRDDRKLGLDIKNKTRSVMCVLWQNSTFATIDGEMAELGVSVKGGRADNPGKMMATIEARDSLTAEVWPADNAFLNLSGMTEVRPLYDSNDGEGSPDDIIGRPIGLDLVMQVDGKSRMFKFRLDVKPVYPVK